MAALTALALLFAGTAVVCECDQVEVLVEDRAELETGELLARAVCGHIEALGRLFRVRARARIRLCADMDCWRRRTGLPPYLAAALAGEEIVTQPARNLRKLKDPARAAVHELVHLLVRRTAGSACPRWLDEGLAQHLAGQQGQGRAPENERELSALEERLRSGDPGRERLGRDYSACLLLVRRLIARTGERPLVRALPDLRKLKDPLDLPVAGNRLRDWLFDPRLR